MFSFWVNFMKYIKGKLSLSQEYRIQKAILTSAEDTSRYKFVKKNAFFNRIPLMIAPNGPGDNKRLSVQVMPLCRITNKKFPKTKAAQSMDASLQWSHNGHDSVANYQPHDCLLNHLFRRRSKKTSNLRVTGLCEGNSPGTGEFPTQMASNAENVSIWWRLHVYSSSA